MTPDIYAWAFLGMFVVTFSIVIMQCVRYLRKLQSSQTPQKPDQPV
jgi:hypothetical protein